MNDLIDRQAAIEAIENLPNCPNGFSDTYDKARIIGVLEDLPSADNENEADIMAMLNESCTDCKEYDNERHCCPRYNRAIREAIAEIKAQERTGKWIGTAYNEALGLYVCSECAKWAFVKSPYCPNCGADMRGDSDEG